jgi:hypothetical protein
MPEEQKEKEQKKASHHGSSSRLARSLIKKATQALGTLPFRFPRLLSKIKGTVPVQKEI